MGEVIVRDYTKRLKPWFHLTVEEKSHLVFQSYKHSILNDEELKPYLNSVRVNNFVNMGFPFLFFPIS